MSIDPSIIQRLSQSLALAFEQSLAPLQAEIDRLRAEVAALRAAAGAGLPAEGGARLSPARAAQATPRVAASRQTAPATTKEVNCLVPRCTAPVLAKQLCETHYRIMRRVVSAGQRFDIKAQRPAGVRVVAPGCGEPGCKEPHYAKGLCRRHYMAARARLRAEESRAGSSKKRPRGPAATSLPVHLQPPVTEEPEPTPVSDTPPEIEWTFADGSQGPSVTLPTAAVVTRVVQQYRGGLTKVAEVLGRNRSSLMELLEKLNLMEQVVTVRNAERKRILAAPLKERLADLLFREKLLEDLGCLKEVDESARNEVQARCEAIAKNAETQDDALRMLGTELGLEESGLKRLVWRYDLRRQIRGLKPRPPTQTIRPRA